MLNTLVRRVKRCLHSRFPGEFILLTSILIILIIAFFGVIVAADNGRPDDAVGYYTRDGNVTWITPEDKGIVADLRGFRRPR